MKVTALLYIWLLLCLTSSMARCASRVRFEIHGDSLIFDSQDSRPDPMTINRIIGEYADVRHLGLFAQGLRDIPDNIRQLKHLRSLDVGANEISTLPRWIADLRELTEVRLGHCYLLDFRQAVGVLSECQNLKQLRIYGNSLTQMPAGIEKLTGLTCLDFSDNNMGSALDEATGLKNLTGLTILDLSNNDLTSLPASIASLQNLEQVRLDRNQKLNLERVFAVLSQLPRLQELSLYSNDLANLPGNVGLLSNLKRLNLDHNNLNSIPVELCTLRKLEYLGLAGNNLRALPSCLSDLSSLQLLVIGANEIDSLEVKRMRDALPDCVILP